MCVSRRCFSLRLSGLARPARCLVCLAGTAAILFLLAQAARAQQAAPKEAGAAKAAPAKKPAGKDEEEPPQPVELKGNDLMTKDGVLLRATFFPSNVGKDAVPVILLHGWKGNRTEYANLAFYLQRLGHAVLVPDLRGHGESTQAKVGTNLVEIDAAKMGTEQFQRMVDYDMETLKGFLRQRNNDAELNLEKLCIVGAEMGSLVALNWAVYDWSWPQYPGKKQGQYVKALVLISPQWNFKGMDSRAAMAHPLVNRLLSVQIFYGTQDSKPAAEAKRIHSALERFHMKPPEDDTEALEKQDLFIKGLDTKLQGTKMLGVRGLGIERRIAQFINLRLVRKDFPWQESGKKQ